MRVVLCNRKGIFLVIKINLVEESYPTGKNNAGRLLLLRCILVSVVLPDDKLGLLNSSELSLSNGFHYLVTVASS